MSDRSIASIARALAAALLAEREKREKRDHEAIEEQQRVAALEAELCAEYRTEVVETLRL